MESNQDAQAGSVNMIAATAPSPTLTPPDSSLGDKRAADQTVDQSNAKRPRMSTLTEGEDDTDSLSDADRTGQAGGGVQAAEDGTARREPRACEAASRGEPDRRCPFGGRQAGTVLRT